jgi:tetratricopeptide (TPR) repeat protein
VRHFPITLFLVGLLCYCVVVGPFASYMRNKPIEEKLGYVPSIKLLKPLSADQKELVGASLVLKVLTYYGGIVGKAEQKVVAAPPDLKDMSRLLHNAVQLDPYNMDAYYFAQSFLTWDAKQYQVANDLLEYGMRYRTWDWYLPYFAGFNYAFFLQDYGKAAEYYRRAGDLSGQELLKSLAGRYLQESGKTELAIAYLTGMAKTAKNEAVRKGYETRLRAFREVRRIELARDRYQADKGRLPDTVEELVAAGYLKPAPVDPYGGTFHFDASRKVYTTSKFAFATKQK